MGKLIYILTNKSFNTNEWVKIGFTTNLEQRLNSLSNTSLPYDYETYATYEVPDCVDLADRTLHRLIAKLNPKLRLVPNKEFFAIKPEDAYEVLEAMAKIHGRLNYLHKYSDSSITTSDKKGQRVIKDYTEQYHLDKMNDSLQNTYFDLKNLILKTFSNVKMKYKKNYVSFTKNGKNFVDIEPRTKVLKLYINLRHAQINDPHHICEDVSNIGHWANGDWRVNITDKSLFDFLPDLIKQSYDKK